MTPVTCMVGRSVALFGLGGSGLATALALKAGGAKVLACDDAPARMEAARAQGIETGDLRSADWSGFQSLVLAPGVPLTHPEPHWTVGLAKAAGIEIIGDIELFCRERAAIALEAPFVAITGTNGKSTTTALIAHMLRSAGRDVQMGGNIGTAILSLAPPSHERVHVIEMSSFQIDLTPSLGGPSFPAPHAEVAGTAGPRSTQNGGASFEADLRPAPQDEEGGKLPLRRAAVPSGPTIGVLLNISPDHLDRHGTMENYAAIKERLVAGAAIAVVGVDDPLSEAVARRAAVEKNGFARAISAERAVDEGVFALGTRIVAAAGYASSPVADIGGVASLRGAHNAQNAAAAVAVCLSLDIPDEKIAAGLRTFPGLAHRMEEVGRRGRVIFVNDSKATNADSAEKALLSFRRIFWILGGKAKAGGIEPLTPYFDRIEKAYLIGEAAEDFAATLADGVPFERCGTLDRAVAAAAEDAARSQAEESVVLLSPACASYDQFPNFEVRGDRFRDLVRALPGIEMRS